VNQVSALVVDDDGDIRDLLRVLLEARGHNVTECASGEAALARCSEDAYELVLLDWMLPGMSGLEVCRALRAQPGGDRCLVLAITARRRSSDLAAILEAGADDYVPKPIDVDQLGVRLAVAERQSENLAERKRAEAALAETFTRLERSHADLQAVLDHLSVGTALADEAGSVVFISRAARALLVIEGRPCDGGTWETCLPLAASEAALVAELAARPAGERGRVPVHVGGEGPGTRDLEIEVLDDPRAEGRRIFCFHDVSEVRALRRALRGDGRFHDLVGQCKPMREVYQLVRDLAPFDATVLIEGETGTGKELVARALHEESRRKGKPFLTVNCAGLTESLLTSQLFGHKRGAFTGAVDDHKGVFEEAAGGTLQLDAVGDMPTVVQTALLRVLQEKEITRVGESRPRKVDVRVVAATHRDLAAEVETGRFRQDLLYRIRVARIRIAPLRERREDISLLIDEFLSEARAATGRPIAEVGPEAMRALTVHRWPGNVRELKSAIEFAVIRCRGSVLKPGDLPPEVLESAPEAAEPAASDWPEDERERLLEALRRAGGKRASAARLLGISRATFYRHLARHTIEP